MALVVWAAALEVERLRRGGAVWVLLTLAGLMRPAAWVLAGLYALWIVWGRPPARGMAIIITGGSRFLKHPAYGPFDQVEDSPRIQVPPERFSRAVVGRRFTAYVRC